MYYHVYILANWSRHLYIGVTRDLTARIYQHRSGSPGGYAHRWRITALVYFESTPNIIAAITREKQLKRWPRWRKVRLIEATNLDWHDLADSWKQGIDHPGSRRADGNP